MTGNANATGDVEENGGRNERVEERLRAVERAITDDERAVADLADGATAVAERDDLRERVSEIESRVEELEAATQAIRGYVGSVRAVNREVERRADIALAAATETRSAESDREGRDGMPPDDLADSISDGSIAGGSITDGRSSSLPDDDPSGDQLDDRSDDPAIAAAVPDDRPGASTDALREDGGDTADSADRSLGNGTLSRLREVL